MNKYIKILMLSGGLVGSIAVTAIDSKQSQNNDLSSIYENVEKMKQALPNLSRINYKLNIDLDQELSEGESDLDSGMPNLEQSSDEVVKDNTNNITFTTTDENGEEHVLDNDETINYLDQTLNQTNIEYEALKTTLSNAIKDTMDYLDAYKNGEKSLTNEQKVYIKEHTNSIKFLAETLENLSEDVICCIDGCEDCDEDDFETTASNYINIINQLETRINALNNAIASLQFINNISNPFFFRVNPNQIIYGYEYNANKENQDNKTALENDQNTDITDNLNQEDNTDNAEKNDNIIEVENDETNNEMSISNDDKPTTFGLKSNIDTYAPTKRNIDTFFNTALYNNDYNRYGGYGYGIPYGGYGMPYGSGFGNPYGANYASPYNEPNSNLINRNELKKQQDSAKTTNASANIETDTSKKSNSKNKKVKKHSNKRVSNIDTYSSTTVKSNINTMGESKISKYFKQKLNTLREKINNKKDYNNQTSKHTLPEITEPLDALDKNNTDNTNSVYNNNYTQDIENNYYSTDNLDKNKIDTEDIDLKQEKDIKAK